MLMLVKLVFLFSLILWILNRYFPSRNAAIGLRFPTAFSSLKKWQQIQGEFYRLLILSNGVLLLLSCFYKISPLKLNALSLLTVLASGSEVSMAIAAASKVPQKKINPNKLNENEDFRKLLRGIK